MHMQNIDDNYGGSACEEVVADLLTSGMGNIISINSDEQQVKGCHNPLSNCGSD